MQFKLPDLGEGLQEAEVVEWLVKEGEKVDIDQLVVSVETAKAIVEIPSPVRAVITKLCAEVGDMVHVDKVLFEYSDNIKHGYKQRALDDNETLKSVSVVGELKTSSELCTESPFTIGAMVTQRKVNGLKEKKVGAPPSIIAFAKKIGVELALESSEYGAISHTDILKIYRSKINTLELNNQPAKRLQPKGVSENKLIKLSGAKKVMAQTMSKSCQQVPAVTLFDDADISLWGQQENITLRALKALIDACVAVPLLNAWFDEENLTIQMFKDINIGVAVNMSDGLFVPVIHKAQTLKPDLLKSSLSSLIEQVKSKKIAPQKLLGATICLSNFGTLSGRYATPIIVPPQVAIIGIGKLRNEAIVQAGEVKIGRILPVSLSFDHRAASGADASAFLVHFIESLKHKVL